MEIDAVALVRSFILTNPVVQKDSTRFITGGGWDHTVWNGTWPSAVFLLLLAIDPQLIIPQADLDLDPIIQGRPIVLQSE